MSAEIYTQADGTTLRRWTNPDGSEWACVAQDHAPGFCRLCVEVDDTIAAILDNVADGLMTVRPTADGRDLECHLTDEGFRRAGHLIRTVTDDVIDAVRDALDDEEDEA